MSRQLNPPAPPGNAQQVGDVLTSIRRLIAQEGAGPDFAGHSRRVDADGATRCTLPLGPRAERIRAVIAREMRAINRADGRLVLGDETRIDETAADDTGLDAPDDPAPFARIMRTDALIAPEPADDQPRRAGGLPPGAAAGPERRNAARAGGHLPQGCHDHAPAGGNTDLPSAGMAAGESRRPVIVRPAAEAAAGGEDCGNSGSLPDAGGLRLKGDTADIADRVRSAALGPPPAAGQAADAADYPSPDSCAATPGHVPVTGGEGGARNVSPASASDPLLAGRSVTDVSDAADHPSPDSGAATPGHVPVTGGEGGARNISPASAFGPAGVSEAVRDRLPQSRDDRPVVEVEADEDGGAEIGLGGGAGISVPRHDADGTDISRPPSVPMQQRPDLAGGGVSHICEETKAMMLAEYDPATMATTPADEAFDLFTADISGDDERHDGGMLRSLIHEVVAQELRGELGQRISRNLRRAIRQEVAAAIAAGLRPGV